MNEPQWLCREECLVIRVNGLVFTGRDLPVIEETLALARGDSSESFYAMFLKCNSRAA